MRVQLNVGQEFDSDQKQRVGFSDGRIVANATDYSDVFVKKSCPRIFETKWFLANQAHSFGADIAGNDPEQASKRTKIRVQRLNGNRNAPCHPVVLPPRPVFRRLATDHVPQLLCDQKKVMFFDVL